MNLLLSDRADLSDDRLKRLAILDFGLFRVHAGRVIGIPGYLLETARGRHILIDTGFPEAYLTDPKGAARRDGLDSFGEIITLTPRETPAGQLALLGLSARDVDLVILTHGDVDHVGALAQFVHAPILVGRAERAEPRPRYFGNARPMEWPEADYRLIDGDTPLCGGITLLATPGHSPGHLSLMLDLPRTGKVILTADAISRPSEPDEGMKGSWDEGLALHHARRLERLAGETGALLIYGHCPVQWPGLRKAPAFYD